MSVDAAAILSQVSGLLGALIGGGASLAVAVYNQRAEERIQRVANEVTRRETIYADFLENASKMLLSAYTHDDIVLGDDEQHLIGLINRMRLFAPPHIVGEAEAVLKAIVEILLKPSIELRQLARELVVQKSRSRPLSEVQPELPGRPGSCASHHKVKQPMPMKHNRKTCPKTCFPRPIPLCLLSKPWLSATSPMAKPALPAHGGARRPKSRCLSCAYELATAITSATTILPPFPLTPDVHRNPTRHSAPRAAHQA